MDGCGMKNPISNKETDFIREEIYPKNRRTTLLSLFLFTPEIQITLFPLPVILSSTSPFGKSGMLGNHLPGPREWQRLCRGFSICRETLRFALDVLALGKIPSPTVECTSGRFSLTHFLLKVPVHRIAVSTDVRFPTSSGLAQVTTRQSLTRQKLEA